jgi:N-acetylmuramoyl-L-alanine amidase
MLTVGDRKHSPMGFRVRTSRSQTWIAALILLTTATSLSLATTPARKKEIARTAYEQAERMREALNGRPEKDRTRPSYQKVIEAYKRVYFTSSASTKADASIVAVAELLAEEGRKFGDEKLLADAITQYEFLRKEYPGSKYRVDALFTIGQIYKEDLKDDGSAKSTFEEFLQRYPKSQLADQAHKALADLSAPPPLTPTEVKAAAVAEQKHAAMPTVNGIRYWSTPDYTRVAIDLDDEVKYEAGRIPKPDRIFFDLHNAKLASTLIGKTFEVGDGFLRTVRVAPYQKDVVRIVLDVEDVSDYSAFLLPNPYRLIIDIHGKKPGSAVAAKRTESKPESVEASSEAPAPEITETAEVKPPAPAKATPAKNHVKKSSDLASADNSDSETKRPETSQKSDSNVAVWHSPSDSSAVKKSAEQLRAEAAEYERKYKEAKEEGKPLPKPDGDIATAKSSVKATTQPTTKPTYQAVEPKSEIAAKTKKSKASATELAEIHEAAPTSSGDRSLIRALGLKINKIVVDAGHGGHDTGTIGPNGLMEKDLVLDVALRLGKLLEDRIGADVVYTRDDDTFVPLETRTAIANQNQADLFISVHANSSRDASARGVETYYLNFTSDPAALDVAARENAVSDKSIHELQDLVKKITLKEKIGESRELASDVESSLATGLSSKSVAMRSRGVKKAPFIVLIGANMPSILAEISFLSNPGDEKKLKTPEYRQKIAESLYRGISRYVSSLSSVKVAQQASKSNGE